VPLVGLETLSATTFTDNNLRQTLPEGDAQSGAVAAESVSVPVTPELLAATLLGLSPEDRARLAAVLLAKQEGQ
jgi:hypothetical protein